MMKRRRFLLTSLTDALAVPLAAKAQQPAKITRIGYLSPPSAAADATHGHAFRQGLRELGYVEGQRIVIDARHANGRLERLPDLAAELVRLNVDVIVAAPTPAVRAAQRATRTVPIVMAYSGDPIGDRFVATLARPGGNITGISAAVPEMASKRVELLKTVVPDLARATHLASPGTTKYALNGAETAGRTLGVQVTTVLVGDASQIARAFATLKPPDPGGLVISLSLQEHYRQIVDLAIKHRLPTVSSPREFVEAGGLMAYGPDYADLFRRAASYVDKILKGSKPADLPVEQPMKFELIINLKAIKALGLTIPPSLLARADLIID
jgi:putative ABC transport system substrate-binding protein